eukprot:SM000144S00663  [mRNA]  locus=s144:75668:78698:- [translate_table: standard]
MASQAEALKSQGNQYFAKDKLAAAIDAYTEAIALCPTVPVYWTNRALCHRKRKYVTPRPVHTRGLRLLASPFLVALLQIVAGPSSPRTDLGPSVESMPSDWPRVETDCKRALELDRESVKAHYMLGLALSQHKCYEDAIRELEKALELARGGKQGNNMVDEIWHELATARFSQWQTESNTRRDRQDRLREHLARLLKQEHQFVRASLDHPSGLKQGLLATDDAHRPARDFRARDCADGAHLHQAKGRVPVEAAQYWNGIKVEDVGEERRPNEGNLPRQGSVEDARDGNEDDWRTRERRRVDDEYAEHLNTLENVFEKAGAPDRPGQVPDHLCCNITMDIYRDPVITPSGISYERSILMEHLKKQGKRFDPVSRAPLDPEQVVPNLALREAVGQYLQDHGWAYRIS